MVPTLSKSSRPVLFWLAGGRERPEALSDDQINRELLHLLRDRLVKRVSTAKLQHVDLFFNGYVYQITADGLAAIASLTKQ